MAKDEIAPEFASRRRARWIVGLSCLLLTVVVVFSARPAWRALKEWRALQLAEEARQYLDEGAIELAWERAQTAYQNFSENAEVARTVAEVYAEGNAAEAVGFWEATYRLSGLQSDLEALIESALDSGALLTAEEYMLKLEPLDASGMTPYFWAKLKLRQGDIDSAVDYARQAVAHPEHPEDAPFFYVQLTQFSPDADIRAEGVRYLRELSLLNNVLGLKALRNLGHFEENTDDDVRALVAAIRNHPLSERADYLYALQLEMQLPDSDRKRNFEQAKTLFNTNKAEDLLELGRWLNTQKRYDQTLELIDYSEAMQRRDLFLVWLDALAITGQWDTIEKALRNPGAPISRELKLLFEARVYFETGQYERAKFAWSRAVLEVADDSRKLWTLERYARTLGLEEQSRQVLDRLTKLAPSKREAYERLVRLDQVDGSTRALRDTLAEMAENYPNDLVIRNDLAYANLLLDENIEASYDVAYDIVSDGSPYLANRVTLALAYYKMGRSIDALEVLAPLNIDWSQTRSGFRAVFVAILRANGQIKEANELLAGIDAKNLLKEERELLGMNRS